MIAAGQTLLVLFCLLPVLLSHSRVAADGRLLDWPSRVMHLQRDEEQSKPPVVTAASLQPGGTLLATAGADHLVGVWDATTGELVHGLDEHTNRVRSVAYSADGTILATGGNEVGSYFGMPQGAERNGFWPITTWQ